MNRKTITWILVLLLSFQLVLGLGIRPAKTTISAEDGPIYEGTLTIVNTDHQEMKLKIHADGEIADFIDIDKKNINFKDVDEAETVHFTIELPEEVPPEALYGLIVVEQEPGKKVQNGVDSRVILNHAVKIEGEIPELYLMAKLNFYDNGDKIRLVSEVENIGHKDISKVQTTFYINDRKQEVQALKTEETSLGLSENKLLDTEISRDNFENGEFSVSAVTDYDGQQTEVVKSLIIGRPEVEVTFFDKYFIANKINQYTLDLLNHWNKEIQNVYVDVAVKKDDEKIDEFRTRSVDIPGEVTKRLEDYFDAKDKSPGEYSFEMVVNFWNTYRMESKTYTSELLTEEEFRGLSREKILESAVSGQPESQEPRSGFWKMAGIVALTLILGFFCILGFGYLKRRKNEYENGPSNDEF